jgi:hypothetical protein
LALFYDHSTGKVKKMTAGGQSPEMARIYENVKDKDETVWGCIARIIEQHAPKSIGINISSNFGFCDGLNKTLYESLFECLKPEFRERLCSAEELSVRWLQRVTKKETELMRVLVGATQDIVKMCFSREYVKPGITKTSDIEWDMRNIISQLGFDYWFGPDVDLQRKAGTSTRMFDTVIEEGDLLHCDIGIIGKYVRLHTDIQWLAYVKKQGEEHAPVGISELLTLGNKFQDIAAGNFKDQLSGNEVFLNSIRQAMDEGLKPMLYSHPLGTFGHGAGPTVGLYDNQVFVKGSGERPVENNTCYALELNICSSVPEWGGQEVYAYLEEDIYFEVRAGFINGRQTELIEI